MFNSLARRFRQQVSSGPSSTGSVEQGDSPSSALPESGGDAATASSTAPSSSSAGRPPIQKQSSSSSFLRTSSARRDSLTEFTVQVPQLAAFDACVATADALASSESGPPTSLTRRHPATGLLDACVLVSPDGHLLLLPPTTNVHPDDGKHHHIQIAKAPPTTDGDEEGTDQSSQQLQGEEGNQRHTADEIYHETVDHVEHGTAVAPPQFVVPSTPIRTIGKRLGSSTPVIDEDTAEITTPARMDAESSGLLASPPPPPPPPVTPNSMASTDSIFSELILNGKDDYASAIFLGNDLEERGDQALNGFSAKGWSLTATSYALGQTHQTLRQVHEFCESIVLARKETAVRINQACDALSAFVPVLGGQAPATSSPTLTLWSEWEHLMDPHLVEFVPHRSSRTGPLLAPESSLNKAMVLMEEYYAQSAEAESNIWRRATIQKDAMVPMLQQALEDFRRRIQRRQQALEESTRRSKAVEERLVKLKQERDKKWDLVYKAEDRVTKRMEALWKERQRQREKQRLNQMRLQDKAQAAAQKEEDSSRKVERSTSSEKEIWDMVSAISEMNDGSFEPMNTISTQFTLEQEDQQQAEENAIANAMVEEISNSISRDVMEREVKLPELRMSAIRADEAIEDAAKSLLQVMSNLDTTRRSARVAAEAALLAATNAHALALRSMVQLEKESLQARMEHLQRLESNMVQIHVRKDLDDYIMNDKRERGGQSHMGDDDDGGIASALAVLSSHVDSTLGDGGADMYNDDDDDEFMGGAASSVTREQVQTAVDALFSEDITQQVSDTTNIPPSSGDGDDVTKKGASVLNDAVEVLCRVAAESTSAGRRRRSTLCYALNSKRSTHARISTQGQFDGLCQVFAATLTSCASDDGGMSNAKMLMMLSQTFYIQNAEEKAEAANDPSATPSRPGRSQRVYLKSRLTDHGIWAKDDFWDEALSQQISESLTQSGVMSNFERESRAQRGNKVDYKQRHKVKWHDLSLEERFGAASQVHAVVFAQLGALAHSMIEFGCGLERSCAFVRRMCIRNQLPAAQRTMLLQHLMARFEEEQLKAAEAEATA